MAVRVLSVVYIWGKTGIVQSIARQQWSKPGSNWRKGKQENMEAGEKGFGNAHTENKISTRNG